MSSERSKLPTGKKGPGWTPGSTSATLSAALAIIILVATGSLWEYCMKKFSRLAGLCETQDLRKDWKVCREFMPTPSVLKVLNFSKKPAVIPKITKPRIVALITAE